MERHTLLLCRSRENPSLDELKILFPQLSDEGLQTLLSQRGVSSFVAAPALYVPEVYHRFEIIPRDLFKERSIRSDASTLLRVHRATRSCPLGSDKGGDEALRYTQEHYASQLEKIPPAYLTAFLRDTKDNRQDSLPRISTVVGARLDRVPMKQSGAGAKDYLEQIEACIDKASLTDHTLRLRERLAVCWGNQSVKSIERNICQYDGAGLGRTGCPHCKRQYGDDCVSVFDTAPMPQCFVDYLFEKGFPFETDPKIIRQNWIREMDGLSSSLA